MERKRFPVFAERFSILRGKMTQDEFARYLGISRPTVGFYENGTRLPDALVLRQIAERCNVSTDWLLGLSEYKDMAQRGLTAEDLGLSEKAATTLSVFQRSGEEQILRSVNSLLEEESLVGGHTPLQSIAAYLFFGKAVERVYKITGDGSIIECRGHQDQKNGFLTDFFSSPLLTIDDQALFDEALYNVMCQSLRTLKIKLRQKMEKEESDNGVPEIENN